MKRILTIYIFLLALQPVSGQVKKSITLEDIFQKETFASEKPNELRQMNDGLSYSLLVNGTTIIKYSYKTGEAVRNVFDLTKIENASVKSFSNYEFSDDETKILLTTDFKPIYRYSFTAKYYVWNSVTEELTTLSEKGAQQLATFSPDGEKVAFVRENNLFIKNLRFGTESQVTFDGQKNRIINGAPDWVYEEEFQFNKAFAWSPDSRLLSYIRFDETHVPDFSMTMFRGAEPELIENKLYPSQETFKYPKAGERNSDVTVKVYELRSRTTINVDLGKDKDFYVPRIKFTPEGNDLAVMRMNRRQNQLDLLYANPNTGDTRLIFTEKNEKYIDESFLDAFTYLPDGKFVVTSERTGWAQLFLYDKQGFETGRITNGEFDVTRFYGFDPARKLFYYQAAAESPLRRETYFISADGKKKGKLSTLQGTNDAEFSKGFNYFINTFSSRKSPALITVHDFTGKQIMTLEANDVLKNKLKEYNFPDFEFFTFKTSEDVQLNGWMLKPPGFDPSKKYPVFMTQYSGPNSQRVTDEWQSINWNDYLAQQGFIVVCVDPRGTAVRGEDFRKLTYLQLGKYESDDQVEAAKYLTSLPFVDAKNIAIYGWSYGGFMTCLTMEKGGSLFKAGIAVAPVTSWRFYDSIYTERYMRTPKENADGYDDNSPLFYPEKIKGRLLIIHGSADDNVHVQNTYEFTEKMVQAGVKFDMAVYTNRNHEISGGNTTMHLYNKMTDFLFSNLYSK